MPLPPLEARLIDRVDAEEIALEKVCKWVPVLGWTVGYLLWQKRTWPIAETISRALTERPCPEPQVWGGDPQRVRLGLYLSRVAQEEMGWPNDHFIPSDPVKVVFWAHEDGLDLEEAVSRIERGLHIKIDDAEVEDWFGRTLGEMADSLLTRLGTG